jgi:predicted phage terminase large subunit-like protein
MSCDTASKTKAHNDFSAFVCVGERQGSYYILDVVRFKYSEPTLLNIISDFYFKWKPHMLLIEDKSSGEGLINWINRDGLKNRQTNIIARPLIKAITPHGSKEERVSACLYLFQEKRVFFPKTAEWLIDYESELSNFPNVKNDDRCDATSQALNYLKNRIPIVTSR